MRIDVWVVKVGTLAMKHARFSKTRAVVWSIIFALGLFALLLSSIAARELANANSPEYAQSFTAWLPDNIFASGAIMAAFALVAGLLCYLLFSRFLRKGLSIDSSKGPKALPLVFEKRSVLVCAAIIFVCWIPIIVIMYPTGMTVDTYNQIYQFQSSAPTYYPTTRVLVDAEFIDHHPVMDTLLYGSFWQIGYWVGSQDIGLFALALIQCIILALELAALTCYLQRLRVPWALRLASLAFFALFPFFGHYSTTVLKDVTYLTFFIPWSLIWVEAARTKGANFRNLGMLVVFMLLGGACIITKKLGVFIWLPSIVALFLCLRDHRLKIALGGVATILAFSFVLPTVLYPAIGGVAPGGRQEMLGPAIQHLTALMIEDEGAFTDQELSDLDKVYKLKKAKRLYEPFRSDGAKSCYRSTTCTDADNARLLQIWLEKGLEHPDVYLKSTMQTCGMLFVPFLKLTYYYDENYRLQRRLYRHYNPEFKVVSISQPEELADINEHLERDSIESKISDLPVVSLFFTLGFYGGCIPLFVLICVLYAKRQSLPRNTPCLVLGIIPVILTIAYYPISPVASPRYVLHLMYLAPLLLGWAWFALSFTSSHVQREIEEN